MGNGKQPLDLSRDDMLQAYTESMANWAQTMEQNSDNTKFGFVDIMGVELQPYGTGYLAVY